MLNDYCNHYFDLPDGPGHRATDPEIFKGLNPFTIGCGCEFKKCCKKYKRGKQCRKCPKR